MSDPASAHPDPTGVRIQWEGYEAILWCSVAVPVLFVAARLYVRARVFRRLFFDDALVVFAWLLQVAYCATQQVYMADMYYIVGVGLGLLAPDATILGHFGRFGTASVAGNVLHAIGLWSVKFSFLVFFRRLGTGVRHQKVIWWTIVCFNIACWVVWLGVIAWPCITRPFLEVVAQCTTIQAGQYSLKVPQIQAAMDIVSDCAILLIPFALLWKVRLRWQQKLSLAGIFSLTLFIMAASIVRAQGSVQGNQEVDEIWLYAWTAIELGVAIVVACLASFRALFTGQKSSQARSSMRDIGDDTVERHGLAKLRSRLFQRPQYRADAESGMVDLKDPALWSQRTVSTHVSTSRPYDSPNSDRINELDSGQLKYPAQVYVHTNLKQSSNPRGLSMNDAEEGLRR